jgi:hypothetical protein
MALSNSSGLMFNRPGTRDLQVARSGQSNDTAATSANTDEGS